LLLVVVLIIFCGVFILVTSNENFDFLLTAVFILVNKNIAVLTYQFWCLI